MDIAAKIKHAPRWAWYTAGGVAVGAGVIRLYQNRTNSAGDTPAASTPDATTIGTDNTVGGGSPGTVIVPPILVPSASGNSDPTGTGGLSATIDGVTGLLGTIGGMFGDVIGDQQSTIHDVIMTQSGVIDDFGMALIANAGSAPQPQAQNPTPFNPPATPATPAPAQPPKVIAQKPQCPGDFPLSDGDTGRDCYRKVCSNGKTKVGGKTLAKGIWHIHKDGRQVRMTTKDC